MTKNFRKDKRFKEFNSIILKNYIKKVNLNISSTSILHKNGSTYKIPLLLKQLVP